MSKIDCSNNLACRQINHAHEPAIRAGMPHAGVAINWNVRPFAVGRGRHFVSGFSVLFYHRNLAAGFRIDDSQGFVPLIIHQEQPLRFRRHHIPFDHGRENNKQNREGDFHYGTIFLGTGNELEFHSRTI